MLSLNNIIQEKIYNLKYIKLVDNMKINSEIKLKYKNSQCAKTTFDSLEIDNEGYLDSKLDEETIIYTIKSKSLGSFLSTADDLISSEIVVEKILNTTNKENI